MCLFRHESRRDENLLRRRCLDNLRTRRLEKLNQSRDLIGDGVFGGDVRHLQDRAPSGGNLTVACRGGLLPIGGRRQAERPGRRAQTRVRRGQQRVRRRHQTLVGGRAGEVGAQREPRAAADGRHLGQAVQVGEQARHRLHLGGEVGAGVPAGEAGRRRTVGAATGLQAAAVRQRRQYRQAEIQGTVGTPSQPAATSDKRNLC